MTLHPQIYKRGSGGEIRVWQMELDGHQHRVISGVLNGNLTTSGWTTCIAKRGTTPETQAEAEVAAAYKKKLEKDYFRDISAIDQVAFTKPMLAETYDPTKISFPVLSQPKLDGMRCVARADGLWSRTGKPITSVPHIVAALAPLFEKRPSLILDGEIYNPELKDDFGTLMSLARGSDPEGRLQYHVYDVVIEGMSVTDRLQTAFHLVQTLHTDRIVLVDTLMVDSAEELDTLNGEYLTEGYEGQMVRIPGSLYENKRSKNLLKRKEFFSEEFPVIEVFPGEGNWAGYAKRFSFRLPDGRPCGAGVRGSQERLKALLEGPMPSWATIRYFTPTPTGMPRFPVVTDWGFGAGRTD